MFKSKFIVPTAVALVTLFVGGIVALAALISPSAVVLHPGFLRGHSASSAVSGEIYGYGYGYGYTDGWGYGYGYGTGAGSENNAMYPYGFFGEDGAPTVDDVTVTRTTATIDFTTTYTTLDIIFDYTDDSVSEGEEAIGSRSLDASGLTCGTTYDYVLTAVDTHGSEWSTSGDFTTSACASSGGGGGGSVGGPGPGFKPITPSTIPGTTIPAGTPGYKAATHPQTLKVPAYGDAVLDLQKFLNDHGYPVSKTGKGSKGNESKYFGPKTKKALIKFQLANGLTPDGILGPKTKAVMLKMLAVK